MYPEQFVSNKKGSYFDIALLLLDEKIKLGEFIMPVCTGLLGDDHYINKQFFVSTTVLLLFTSKLYKTIIKSYCNCK